MPASRSEVIFVISIIAIFMLIMVAFVVIILFFIRKKQQNFSSDLDAVKTNYDMELYKAQMEIQEQTFRQISREIHDNVGQIISMAKLGLNTLDLGMNEETKKDAYNISEMLDSALDELRHMSRSMNADYIKKRGLQKSLEMQVVFLQKNANFQTDFFVEGSEVRISETKEIILFRILQEALNNILRHAGATEVSISLNYGTESLTLTIRDDGKGFQKEEEKLSHGIANMRYRSELIGANFQINSQINKGTEIVVTTNY